MHVGTSCSLRINLDPLVHQSNNGRCSYDPQRVEGLWSAQPRRRAIAIAAAEFSTLVLTLPPTVRGGGAETTSLATMPVNSVYGWGHGNHSVMRVVFPSGATAGNNVSVNARSSCINPTAIACAKYHNVAITVDGRVYTWGLHSESLGTNNGTVGLKHADSEWSVATDGRRPRSNSLTNPTPMSPSASASAASAPQLVTGMLPENGGGKAIAVSASESHTAVVTSDGHLFTWGTSVGNNILGHKGVKWQPSPRKVQRVHRTVGVAAAKEHTVLLMATTFPPLNESSHGNQALTLQNCAAIEISRNVDMFNVIPTALIARRLGSLPLINFCDEFIRKNLDGVLAVGNKNDFASFLSCSRTALVGRIRIGHERDGTFHPFLYDIANSKNWADGSQALLKEYAIAPQRSKVKRRTRREKHPSRPVDCTEENAQHVAEKINVATQTVAKKVEVALKSKKASTPHVAKSNKGDQLQVQRQLFPEKAESKVAAADNTPKFCCDVCNVVCPDSDSYTLHMNGRKHRNRLAHASAEEEKKVAESMMATKRKVMMMKISGDGVIGKSVENDQVTMDCKSPIEIKKSICAWANYNTSSPLEQPSERRERSKSFQEIVNEQQQRSSILAMSSKTPIATKRPSGSVRSNNAVAFNPAQTQNTFAYGMKTPPPISSPVPSLPLSAFMKKGSERRPVETLDCIGATWGARQTITKDNSKPGKGWGVLPAQKNTVGPQHSSTTKSFSEIQQEEEALRSNEDHMCHIKGNHWYVQQRERAASIGEIQDQEEKDKEMQLFIEEQRRIENDIRAQAKQMQRDAKRNRKKQGRPSRSTNPG